MRVGVRVRVRIGVRNSVRVRIGVRNSVRVRAGAWSTSLGARHLVYS